MPPAIFEPAVPVSEQPQTHVLDSAATATGISTFTAQYKITVFIAYFTVSLLF
jgi:hypothetical protein